MWSVTAHARVKNLHCWSSYTGLEFSSLLDFNPKPLPILAVHVLAKEWFTCTRLHLLEVHYSQLTFSPQPSISVSCSANDVVCIKNSLRHTGKHYFCYTRASNFCFNFSQFHLNDLLWWFFHFLIKTHLVTMKTVNGCCNQEHNYMFSLPIGS